MNPRQLRRLERQYGTASEPMVAVLGILSAHRSGLRGLNPDDLSEFSWLEPGSTLRLGFTVEDVEIFERGLPSWLASPEKLAETWARIINRVGPPKLALLLEEESPELLGALTELLTRKSLQTSAVHVEAGARGQQRNLQWPLVISSPTSQRRRLHEVIEDLPDGAEQARWRPLSGADSADLLFVPPTVTFVPGATGIQARQLGASAMALAFANPKAGAASTMSFGLRLRYGLETEAVAVVRASGKTRDDFCLAFLAELSRGRTFAEAVTQAGREYLARPPFLLTSNEFLKQTRLPPRDEGRSFDNLRQLAEDLGKRPEGQPLELPEELARTLGLKQRAPSPRELEGAVRDFLATRSVEGSEGLQATYAKLRRSVRVRGRTAERPAGWGTELSMAPDSRRTGEERSIPRHLHANVISTQGGEETPIFHPLVAGMDYRVDVQLGPADARSNFLATTFPEDRLPPSSAGHELTVVFADLSAGRPSPPLPRIAHIHLGPQGQSSRCSFAFTAPPAGDSGAGRFVARILVMHRNRILQTVLLSSPIVAAQRRGSVPGGVRLDLELAPTASLERLEDRIPFDAALVVNHDVEATSRIMSVEDQDVRWVRVGNGDLERTTQLIKTRIDQLTSEEERPRDLSDGRLLDLFFMLAHQGRFLWEEVIDSSGVGDGLRHGQRIQILEAQWGSFLPVEFFYEFPVPRQGAKLCPEARQALLKGQCTASHHHDEETAGDYICPLGFWGLTRIIERQDASEESSAKGEVILRPAPSPKSREIPLLRRGVFGASHRVDEVQAGSAQLLMQSIQLLWPNCMEQATGWAAWKKTVQQADPSLLVLVVHTEMNQKTLTPSLEIAHESLTLMEFEHAHLRSKAARDGVLVLLMGCSTALPWIRSQSFVRRILKHGGGSAIVVSSIANMLGRYAAPTTTTLLQGLSQLAKPGPIDVGQAFVRLRRMLLAEGDPLVLCLTLYGDTDWKLVTPVGASE